MKTRTLGILTLLVALTTTIWLALVIMIEFQKDPAQTLSSEVAFIESHWRIFSLNYINASLITFTKPPASIRQKYTPAAMGRLWSFVPSQSI